MERLAGVGAVMYKWCHFLNVGGVCGGSQHGWSDHQTVCVCVCKSEQLEWRRCWCYPESSAALWIVEWVSVLCWTPGRVSVQIITPTIRLSVWQCVRWTENLQRSFSCWSVFLFPRRVVCCWRVSSSEALLLNLSLLISWGFKTSETLPSAAVEQCTCSESVMKHSTDTTLFRWKKIYNPQTLESFCINY